MPHAASGEVGSGSVALTLLLLDPRKLTKSIEHIHGRLSPTGRSATIWNIVIYAHRLLTISAVGISPEVERDIELLRKPSLAYWCRFMSMWAPSEKRPSNRAGWLLTSSL